MRALWIVSAPSATWHLQSFGERATCVMVTVASGLSSVTMKVLPPFTCLLLLGFPFGDSRLSEEHLGEFVLLCDKLSFLV